MMDIEVSSASIDDKPVLRNMFELYRHDFSEFDGRELSEHGLYDYAYLDHYWTDAHRHPFLVRVNGNLAGFALVSQLRRDEGTETRFSEFFIVRKYRRQGVGEYVARHLFDRFPGRWGLSEHERNTPAQRFWRTVIERHVGGAVVERRDTAQGRVIQEFDVPDARQPH